jgi:hypothetical protein
MRRQTAKLHFLECFKQVTCLSKSMVNLHELNMALLVNGVPESLWCTTALWLEKG